MLRRLIVLLSVLALSITGVALAAKPKAKKDHGTAWAGITHTEGGYLYVAGDLKDKLLGRGAIVYITKPSGSSAPGTIKVNAKKITIYTPKGSLTGKGTGDQVTHPDNSVTVENGTFKLTKGTQKLKGHTYKGTFSATFADGVYTFTYKGTYR